MFQRIIFRTVLGCVLVIFCVAAVSTNQPPQLKPILKDPAHANLSDWAQQRKEIINQWLAALGTPDRYDYTPEQKMAEEFETPDFKGIIYLQRTGPESSQKVLLMIPLNLKKPAPGVIIPFYHPDGMCGYDLANKTRTTAEKNVTYFGLHLVKQGYVVASCEAYPFNLIPLPAECKNRDDFKVWRFAADYLNKRYPSWTGVGKLTYDTRKAIDLLVSSGLVDTNKLAIMGHSLGGKMAFYTGCLDERINVIVGNDFGIGWDFTNWSDPWYFGEKLKKMRADGLEHHQLLACKAPAPFLLIAGQTDHDGSRAYLNEARKVYDLYNAGNNIEFINHKSGHRPSWDALRRTYVWMAEKLGIPQPDLKFLDELEQQESQAKKK
ncbi:MAG: prolyl oligopeptidase family serine peptidase [Kiritimatiellae bacterium]|nr:prolyl oligopeptidase family serine peptidase [Kiritimatiellia bacterium]MDD5522313.1 prolyl oligopeptidase family serine peptidase [Kiritimatiellia bacterium]